MKGVNDDAPAIKYLIVISIICQWNGRNDLTPLNVVMPCPIKHNKRMWHAVNFKNITAAGDVDTMLRCWWKYFRFYLFKCKNYIYICMCIIKHIKVSYVKVFIIIIIKMEKTITIKNDKLYKIIIYLDTLI